MHRLLIPALAGFLLSACTATDVVQPADANGRAAARPDGYRLVHLRADAPPQPGEAGAPLVRTLAQAVERVAAGGTILIHPGEYTAESVHITRPMTIEAAGGAKPVIRTTTDLQGVFVEHVEGTVVFRGLEFRNDFAEIFRGDVPVFSYSIRGGPQFANVLVEDSDFIMRTGGHASGIQFSGGGIADNSRFVVRRSTFTGGRAGVASTGNAVRPPASAIEIRESRFTGQRPAHPDISNFAIQVRSPDVTIAGNTILDCGDRCINVFGGEFQVADNVMRDCGIAYCIQAVGSGAIVRNQLSNSIAGEYDSFFHHVLLLAGQTDAIVEDNDILGCGHGQCITAVFRATGEIRNNRITARHGERTRIAIVLSDNSGGDSPETDRGASFQVSGNIITGEGSLAATDPDNPDAYPYSVAALVNEGHSTMTAAGNTIRDANHGVITRTGSVMTGSRNTISGVRVGIGTFANAGATNFNWNDVQAFRAFDIVTETGTDITCNWWGGDDGAPQNFFGSPASSVYVPWATEPVAATGAGDCTGGLFTKKPTR